MIAGTLIIEDCTLNFCVQDDEATYTVADHMNGRETRKVPTAAFMKALAIAVHWDGEPNAERDYPEAESVQPLNRTLRWIP